MFVWSAISCCSFARSKNWPTIQELLNWNDGIQSCGVLASTTWNLFDHFVWVAFVGSNIRAVKCDVPVLRVGVQFLKNGSLRFVK